ncbi:MAG: hypothetical protein ABJI96_15405 [Paracoccaceae bacterium]
MRALHFAFPLIVASSGAFAAQSFDVAELCARIAVRYETISEQASNLPGVSDSQKLRVAAMYDEGRVDFQTALIVFGENALSILSPENDELRNLHRNIARCIAGNECDSMTTNKEGSDFRVSLIRACRKDFLRTEY